MLFNSINFAMFFPIVIIVYFILPSKVRHIWLLFASYFFYMNFNSKYVLLLILVTLISYGSAVIMQIINDKSDKINHNAIGGGKSFFLF